MPGRLFAGLGDVEVWRGEAVFTAGRIEGLANSADGLLGGEGENRRGLVVAKQASSDGAVFESGIEGEPNLSWVGAKYIGQRLVRVEQ